VELCGDETRRRRDVPPPGSRVHACVLDHHRSVPLGRPGLVRSEVDEARVVMLQLGRDLVRGLVVIPPPRLRAVARVRDEDDRKAQLPGDVIGLEVDYASIQVRQLRGEGTRRKTKPPPPPAFVDTGVLDRDSAERRG